MDTEIQITIRAANYAHAADANAIIMLLDSYASDPIGGGQPLTPEIRQRLIPGLSQQPHSVTLLAFHAAQPVGMAICFEGFSTFSARGLINIHDLAVLPKYRGRGIGTELLRAVERLARDRDCCKITLEVQDNNQRAEALYRRCGFADVVIGAAEATRFLAKPLA